MLEACLEYMKKVPISVSCAIRPSSPHSLNTVEMFVKLEVNCTGNSTIPILDETSHHLIQIIEPLTPWAASAVGRFQPGAPYAESSKAGKMMRRLLQNKISTGNQSSLPSAWPTAAAPHISSSFRFHVISVTPMRDPARESTQDTY